MGFFFVCFGLVFVFVWFFFFVIWHHSVTFFFPLLLNAPCLAKIKGVLTEKELKFGPTKLLVNDQVI